MRTIAFNERYIGGSETLEHELSKNLQDETMVRQVSSEDLIKILYTLLDRLEGSQRRLRIFTYWLSELAGRPLMSRDGAIAQIAKDMKISTRSVSTHIKAITNDSLLGQALKYMDKSREKKRKGSGLQEAC